MAKMKILILTNFLISSTLTSFAQYDSIIHRKNFICYKPTKSGYFDTLNRTDENGLRQGKWIEYDSTQTRHCKVILHGDDKTRSDSTVKRKDPCGPFFWTYKIRWTGNYIDNRKVGIWKNTYKTELNRIELNYINGILEMPILIYTSGRIGSKLTYDSIRNEYRQTGYDQLGNETNVFYFKTLELFSSMTGIEFR